MQTVKTKFKFNKINGFDADEARARSPLQRRRNKLPCRFYVRIACS
jgi:hypothetical protein